MSLKVLHVFGAGVGALGLSAGMQVSGLDSVAKTMGSGSLGCFERNHGAFGTRRRLERVFEKTSSFHLFSYILLSNKF